MDCGEPIAFPLHQHQAFFAPKLQFATQQVLVYGHLPGTRLQ